MKRGAKPCAASIALNAMARGESTILPWPAGGKEAVRFYTRVRAMLCYWQLQRKTVFRMTTVDDGIQITRRA